MDEAARQHECSSQKRPTVAPSLDTDTQHHVTNAMLVQHVVPCSPGLICRRKSCRFPMGWSQRSLTRQAHRLRPLWALCVAHRRWLPEYLQSLPQKQHFPHRVTGMRGAGGAHIIWSIGARRIEALSLILIDTDSSDKVYILPELRGATKQRRGCGSAWRGRN